MIIGQTERINLGKGPTVFHQTAKAYRLLLSGELFVGFKN
jgi:hypothetical protein